ncbi:MAG: PAS domain S-box protein [Methanocalculaceae archaeon]|jgi:PAS domain S-box-containing protein|nr:PAS domain S-box protein [Methanocalculaceae archaeon]
MSESVNDFSDILSLLKDNPRGMSITEIAEAAHLNRNTIARYMDTLLVSGQVELRTFGKAKVFFISKRIPVSAMLNLSSDMVLLVDEDLRVIQVNDALLSFLSVTSNEIIDSLIYEGPAKPLCSDILTDQIRCAIHGDIVRGELRIFRNNQEYYLDQKVYPMVLVDGKPGVTVVLDDITEHVHAEAALERSEAMFRMLVETVHDCIWSVDENAIICYISPQITAICGYTPGEMIGRKFSDFMPSGANARFSWELTSRISRENGFTLFEFPFVCKDGTRIYCEFSGTPMILDKESNMFLGYNGALRDVTDRRYAELGIKRWKMFLDCVMDNIPGIIIVTDVKTNTIVYSNLATEHFLHMNRSEIWNIPSSKLLIHLGSTNLINAHDQAKAFCRPVNIQEDRVEVDGAIRHISARVLPMVLSADRVYLLTIITDISDEVADRNNQLLIQEFVFALDSVSSTQDIWDLVVEMLPKIIGFEAVAVYQQNISGDYVLFVFNGGKFDLVIPRDSIVDRIIRKGEPTIFDKYRIDLFPEGTFSIMNNPASLVLLPIVHENKTVACIVLGSATQQSPDTVFRGVVMSMSFQISTVVSRCFLQE